MIMSGNDVTIIGKYGGLVEEKFLTAGLEKAADAENLLEEFLRQKILNEEFAEGQKLPSTLPWAKALKINDRRLQRVLSRLTAQGYLERRPRYGTYVRRRIGQPTVVILCGWPLVMEHLHFLRKIIELLIEELRVLNYQAEVIDNLFSVLTNNFEEQQQKVEKLRQRILEIEPVGYVECAFDLSRLPDLYPELERPLVSFYPTTSGGDVYIDEEEFLRESLKYLASKGRRKVLLIRNAGRLGTVHRATAVFWKSVEEFGFIRGTFRELYHGSSTDAMEEEAYRWMLQLIQSWKSLRKNYVPDCLLVADDIVMRGIAAALVHAKVRIPEDLIVVTKANESIRFQYGIPVVRCEGSLREVSLNLAHLLHDRIEKRKSIKAPILISKTRIVEPSLQP